VNLTLLVLNTRRVGIEQPTMANALQGWSAMLSSNGTPMRTAGVAPCLPGLLCLSFVGTTWDGPGRGCSR